MAILELNNIHKDFISGLRTVKAVAGITTKINAGEMVAVTGPSGAGKSTVLQIAAGIMKPSSGSVTIDGQDIYKMSRDKLAKFRRERTSYVFQHFNLLPMLTARENIAIPSLLENIKPKDEDMARIAENLGISHRLDHFPSELSGGEQQRVAIARALINDPAVIFADEPTGNLDGQSTRDVMELFAELNRAGKTIIIVTHDPEVAAYCSRVLHIVDGVLT